MSDRLGAGAVLGVELPEGRMKPTRFDWDASHPQWAGRSFCRSCEMPVGERHQADCPGYPRTVKPEEGVRP